MGDLHMFCGACYVYMLHGVLCSWCMLNLSHLILQLFVRFVGNFASRRSLPVAACAASGGTNLECAFVEWGLAILRFGGVCIGVTSQMQKCVLEPTLYFSTAVGALGCGTIMRDL